MYMEQVIKNTFPPDGQEAQEAPEQKSDHATHEHETEIAEEKMEEVYPNENIEQHGSKKESE
mgnify:FL=1